MLSLIFFAYAAALVLLVIKATSTKGSSNHKVLKKALSNIEQTVPTKVCAPPAPVVRIEIDSGMTYQDLHRVVQNELVKLNVEQGFALEKLYVELHVYKKK